MPRWKVSFDETARVHRHRVPRGFGHAIMSSIGVTAFRTLRVSASLTDGSFWWPLHTEPNVATFEGEHAVQQARYAYNHRLVAEARRTRKAALGEYAGYSDLFVPLVAGRGVEGLIITGPFVRARPTSTEILERWRTLTGRQGHPTDPEFAAYLSTALGTLVLDDDALNAFEGFVSRLASLMAGVGPADRLANESERLYLELWRTRSVERSWDAVQDMLDDRFPKKWQGAGFADPLRILGLARFPEHVLVGLCVGRKGALEPVEEMVRRDAFQRACVKLARAERGVVAGRIGEDGAVFLAAPSGGPERRRARVREFAERVATLARRHGLAVHFGDSAVPASRPLGDSYQAALAAAQTALTQGKAVALGATNVGGRQSLRQLRRELVATVETKPEQLQARFDRYVEGVAAEYGHRSELVRAHLDFGFEQLAETLVSRGQLDEKSFRALEAGLERAAAGAPNLNELYAAYRRAAGDVAEAVRDPVAGRHERGLRGAIDYMRRHYGERLTLERVASVAGFAPHYFSKLFIDREHMRFGDYLRELRLERAKQLLGDTGLDVTRVAELSGFASVQYFCRAFRHSVGVRPLDYRRSPGKFRRDSRSTNTKAVNHKPRKSLRR